MVHIKSQPSNIYRIRIKETLDNTFADWLDNMVIFPQENGETQLICTFPDQPALRGFLDQLWNLNISVISIERVENEK